MDIASKYSKYFKPVEGSLEKAPPCIEREIVESSYNIDSPKRF